MHQNDTRKAHKQ